MEKSTGIAKLHPSFKQWPSHTVKLGRMKIEDKKAKVSDSDVVSSATNSKQNTFVYM